MDYQPGGNGTKLDNNDIANSYPKLIDRANNAVRFSGKNGILVDKLFYGGATGYMEITEQLKNPLGGVHGGALSTLADTVAGIAVATLGFTGVTLSNTMNYHREVRLGTVYCSAEVTKAGKKITVCDVKMTDTEDRLVATGTFTFFIKGEITSVLE